MGVIGVPDAGPGIFAPPVAGRQARRPPAAHKNEAPDGRGLGPCGPPGPGEGPGAGVRRLRVDQAARRWVSPPPTKKLVM